MALFGGGGGHNAGFGGVEIGGEEETLVGDVGGARGREVDGGARGDGSQVGRGLVAGAEGAEGGCCAIEERGTNVQVREARNTSMG